jgi:hypothetical protein
MKTYTLKDIDALDPCYDPRDFVSENWSGTLLDILNVEKANPADRIWVVTKLLDDKTNRLFAVWCGREALKLIENPDPRSVTACDVAERFANGGATAEELAAAAAAAYAAYYAAHAAAAAYYAAHAAAAAHAAHAADAADADADAAARQKQIEKLKEMVSENARTT